MSVCVVLFMIVTENNITDISVSVAQRQASFQYFRKLRNVGYPLKQHSYSFVAQLIVLSGKGITEVY